MRIAAQFGRVGVVAMMLGVGCGASYTDASPVAAAGNAGAMQEAGSGGMPEPASEGGAAGVPSASGGAAAESEGGAAGDGSACSGNYPCPLVGYGSHAGITFDLPISVAAAADAVFTACRNSECHTAKGSATAAPNGNPRWGWAYEDSGSGRSIYLTFGDSGSAPFGVLLWDFELDFETIASDHYSLTVQPVGASAPTTLFDTSVAYNIVAADPTLVDEGFCYRCSEVSIADIDLRTTK